MKIEQQEVDKSGFKAPYGKYVEVFNIDTGEPTDIYFTVWDAGVEYPEVEFKYSDLKNEVVKLLPFQKEKNEWPGVGLFNRYATCIPG